MRYMRRSTRLVALSIIAALFVGVKLMAPPEASAQATISTGSVQGAILDPKGAVGVITSANITLELGSESTVITVESSAISVNTEQATVQGVLTAQQIENLPVNGRNFLDLAQLEPGVQIQDGANFDPTKNGVSSVSFAGHFGRTA